MAGLWPVAATPLAAEEERADGAELELRALARLLQWKITSPYKSMSYDITYRAWHYATGSDYLDED